MIDTKNIALTDHDAAQVIRLDDDLATSGIGRDCIICEKMIPLPGPWSQKMICDECIGALRKVIKQVNGDK